MLHVVGDDLGNQSLECLVPPILLVIEHAMAMRNPTDVARPKLSQAVLHIGGALVLEQTLDLLHRAHDQPLIISRQMPKHVRHRELLSRFDVVEDAAPLRAESEDRLPAIRS